MTKDELHSILGPLSGVSGELHNLLDGTTSPSEEKIQSCLDKVQYVLNLLRTLAKDSK